MTERVFVANRGEIALRIIEACDRLGYETVLGVSAADRDSLAARRAGRVLTLGGPRSTDSYLLVPAVMHAAIETGCTALHPGYGFLSERPELARLCAENGIAFIGPSPEALEALGDKVKARALAESLDVPVAPGGTAESLEEVRDLAAAIGFPVLVKAAHGGGGRGMKLVHAADELEEAWRVASSEAQSAFGDGTVFLERYRHRRPAHRGPGPRRPPWPPHPPRRAGLLGAAPLPEGGRGGAVHGDRPAHPRPALRERPQARRRPRLRRAGHRRVPVRRGAQGGQLPRGQPARAGGAPGHRGRHRGGPGP